MKIKAFVSRYLIVIVAGILYLTSMGLLLWSAIRLLIYENNAVFLYIWLVAFVLGSIAIWQPMKLVIKLYKEK